MNPLIATRQERQAMWSSLMRDAELTAVERLRASELLARSEGDFLDRLENVGNVTIKVVDPYAEPPKGRS